MTYGQEPGGPSGHGGSGYPGKQYAHQQGSGQRYPEGYQPPRPLRPEDQRLWATLTHVGGILFTVVAPLVAYLVLRDRGDFVREHTRVALNFHITMAIAYAVGVVTAWLLIGVFIALAVAVVSLVFGIIAAVAASQGQLYRYPLSIEFVKQ
jgi:hypothetical protein